VYQVAACTVILAQCSVWNSQHLYVHATSSYLAEVQGAAIGAAEDVTTKSKLKKDMKGKVPTSKTPARKSKAAFGTLKVRKKPTAKKCRPREKSMKTQASRNTVVAGAKEKQQKKENSRKSAVTESLKSTPAAGSKRVVGKKRQHNVSSEEDEDEGDDDDMGADPSLDSKDDDYSGSE
jgi:hypothetical protein